MGAAQTRARAEKTVRVFLFSSGLQISEVLSVHVNVRYISGSPTIGLVGRVGGSLTFMKPAADVTVLLSICTCSHVDAHVHVQVQVALPSLRMGLISRVPPDLFRACVDCGLKTGCYCDGPLGNVSGCLFGARV